MIALPSIAFGGFSGSAKGVTARQVGGRSILSLKCYPTGVATGAQLARRASLKKISKNWVLLTNEQRADWDRLAEHATGASSLGQKAELSGLNLYVRLNTNRVMAGEAVLSDAPASTVAVPVASFSKAIVTPELVILNGIEHEPSPNKLVIKMSGCQSPGVSSGWSKTVIISSDFEDDWGEADVTVLYLKTIGVEPVPGQKVFIETYWLDTSTGFTGQEQKGSVIVLTQEQAREQGYAPRMRVNMDGIDQEESEAVAFNLDFSTGAPLLNHSGVLTSTPSQGFSTIYLLEPIDVVNGSVSYCLVRGTTDADRMFCGSAQCYVRNLLGKTEITYGHRGGEYPKPAEVFGPGIMY